MNLPQATLLAESYLQQYNLHTVGWAIRFTSSKRRFGCCNYYTKVISISKYLTIVNEPEQVIDTILHEIAHALAPPYSGHGIEWKAICTRIGARPERCYGREVTRVHRWIATCPGCRRVIKKNRVRWKQPTLGSDGMMHFSYCLACGPGNGRLTYTVNPEFEKIFQLTKKSIDKPELPEVQFQIEQNGMLKMTKAMISTNKSRGSTVSAIAAVKPKPNPARGSNTNTNDSISNSNQEKEKEVNFMALVLIKKSSLPVSPRGKTGSISVAVRENGQIGFSTSAGKVFDNFTHCAIGWDVDGRLMTFYPVNDKKLPKGIDADNLMVVGQSKDGQRYISAAGVFKLDWISYDYKSAGTHSFVATILEGNKGVSFSLPVKMDRKPTQVRVRKAKSAVAGVTNGGQTEPVLQEA